MQLASLATCHLDMGNPPEWRELHSLGIVLSFLVNFKTVAFASVLSRWDRCRDQEWKWAVIPNFMVDTRQVTSDSKLSLFLHTAKLQWSDNQIKQCYTFNVNESDAIKGRSWLVLYFWVKKAIPKIVLFGKNINDTI